METAPHVKARGLEGIPLLTALAVGDIRQHPVLGGERTTEAVTERVIALKGRTRVADSSSRRRTLGIERQGVRRDDLLPGVALK